MLVFEHFPSYHFHNKQSDVLRALHMNLNKSERARSAEVTAFEADGEDADVAVSSKQSSSREMVSTSFGEGDSAILREVSFESRRGEAELGLLLGSRDGFFVRGQIISRFLKTTVPFSLAYSSLLTWEAKRPLRS